MAQDAWVLSGSRDSPEANRSENSGRQGRISIYKRAGIGLLAWWALAAGGNRCNLARRIQEGHFLPTASDNLHADWQALG